MVGGNTVRADGMAVSYHMACVGDIQRGERQVSDEQFKLINNLTHCLRGLVIQVREDIPEEQGTDHLWNAVEDAEFLLGFIDGDLYTEDKQ